MQIDNGELKVLVAIGGQAHAILLFMRDNGLIAPRIDQIPHYSYIMMRPESKHRSPGAKRLGLAHPTRIKEFKEAIFRIKRLYWT